MAASWELRYGPAMRVLVVEDDQAIRSAVARRLRAVGFAVDEAPDLVDADLALNVNPYDCLVLDRRLPSGDALDFLVACRRSGLDTPALFLTARDTVEDRVAGFEGGGDDYLTKPFAMEELVARVRGLCRRSGQTRPPILRWGDLEFDGGRREVRRAGVLLPLTARERCVLECLLAAHGSVVSRADLIDHCWDELNDPFSNVVDVHIAALRRKLGAPPLIHTVRAAGYLLDAPAE